MQVPRVSVVIPAYNYARYLPEAIESVLAQDVTDFEVLIADNASTDGSADLIARFAARDPRIRGHTHPESVGMVQNFNWCLSHARGTYIKFLCADDKLASPAALSTLLRLLDTNPSAVLAASARLIIDDTSRVLGIADELRPGLHGGEEIIAQSILRYTNLIGEPSAVMFRERDGRRGFDPGYQQLVDLEMWLNLLEQGTLVYTDQPLVCFRKHALQQTAAISAAGILGRQESARLFWGYYHRPFIRQRPDHRRLLFKQLHELQKTRRRWPAARPLEQEMYGRMGPVWYGLLWMQYRARRPFERLGRAWRRRIRRAAYERQSSRDGRA